jgi:hypothetical protein
VLDKLKLTYIYFISCNYTMTDPCNHPMTDPDIMRMLIMKSLYLVTKESAREKELANMWLKCL